MKLKEFMASIAGLSENTRRNYEATLLMLNDVSAGNEPTDEEIAAFLAKYKTASMQRHKAAIKYYLEFMDRKWPFGRHQFPVSKRHSIRYVPPLRIPDLIKATGNADDAMAIKTIFNLGARISELMGITRDNIQPAGVIVLGKGGAEKLIPTTPNFNAELMAYAGGTQGRIFPHNYAYYNKLIKKVGQDAGIKNLCLHMLRHCLSPDTMIVTPDGAWSLFDCYTKEDASILSVNMTTGEVNHGRITEKVTHQQQNMLEIWAGGRRICCGPQHRLFKSNFVGGIKEICAKDIRRGMYLAGVRRIEPVGKIFYPPEVWRLVGYFLGDGYLREREIGFSDKSEGNLQYYKKILSNLGVESKIAPYTDRGGLKLTLSNKYIEGFFREIGLSSINRRVPLQAYQSRESDIACLIAGFYDAEGNEGSSCRLFSSDVRLLQDMQMLFLYLGIGSSLGGQWRMVTLPQGGEKHSHIYTLNVCSDIKSFQSKIPTLKAVHGQRNILNPTGEDIPIGHYLKNKVIERQRAGVSIWKEYPFSLARYALENHQPTRRNLTNWQQYIDTPIIRKMLSFAWLKVTKISKINYKTSSIDIGVEPSESFIADGFISHNSRAVDLLKKDMKLPFVQQFLRHKKLETTALYLEITGGELGGELMKAERPRESIAPGPGRKPRAPLKEPKIDKKADKEA